MIRQKAVLTVADGRLVTSEKGLPRIKIHDGDGSFMGVVASPECFDENEKACCGSGAVTPPLADLTRCQSGGIDVAVDSQGRVFAMDPVEGIVQIFKPSDSI